MKKNLLLGLLLSSGMMFAQDPVIINGDFSIVPKDSGSDCACAAWINKDLGDQAEGSSDIDGSGANDAIKFDDFESDIMYQEIAVLPNTNYTLNYSYRISGEGTSELEIRVLTDAGYIDGYAPVFYATAPEFPQRDKGYVDITVVEDDANNLVSEVHAFPGNGDYNAAELNFTTGDETSIAVFARGIGSPTTPPVDGKEYLWSSGDQETRMDFVSITNDGPADTASSDDVLASKFAVYPNPASDVVSISSDVELASVVLYNALGAKVYASTNTASFSVAGLAKGVYFLKVDSADSSATKKLIVE